MFGKTYGSPRSQDLMGLLPLVPAPASACLSPLLLLHLGWLVAFLGSKLGAGHRRPGHPGASHLGAQNTRAGPAWLGAPAHAAGGRPLRLRRGLAARVERGARRPRLPPAAGSLKAEVEQEARRPRLPLAAGQPARATNSRRGATAVAGVRRPQGLACSGGWRRPWRGARPRAEPGPGPKTAGPGVRCQHPPPRTPRSSACGRCTTRRTTGTRTTSSRPSPRRLPPLKARAGPRLACATCRRPTRRLGAGETQVPLKTPEVRNRPGTGSEGGDLEDSPGGPWVTQPFGPSKAWGEGASHPSTAYGQRSRPRRPEAG